MIRDFESWLDSLKRPESERSLKEKHAIDSEKRYEKFYICGEDLNDSYNAGVKAATDYYENDRILIHQYYTKQVKKLVGNETELEPYSENNGKLT